MVRLKGLGLPKKYFLDKLFQFHNGSIKSGGSQNLDQTLAIFQFHNGSIKSMNDYEDFAPSLYFNSTMVRLKVRLGYSVFDRAGFQFHNGSIKSPEDFKRAR